MIARVLAAERLVNAWWYQSACLVTGIALVLALEVKPSLGAGVFFGVLVGLAAGATLAFVIDGLRRPREYRWHLFGLTVGEAVFLGATLPRISYFDTEIWFEIIYAAGLVGVFSFLFLGLAAETIFDRRTPGNFRCWLFGHRFPQYDPQGICTRCGDGTYDALVYEAAYIRLVGWARNKAIALKILPCPMCGKRFGCDPADPNHIPF